MHRHSLLPLLIVAVLAACQSNPPQPDDQTTKPASRTADVATPSSASTSAEKSASKQAESSLAAGVKAYENGDYKASQQELQAALAVGLVNPDDQIRANKLLAFIACAGKQRAVCKAYFLKVFAINPDFALSKSESGHPLWGPVFKEAKVEAAKRK